MKKISAVMVMGFSLFVTFFSAQAQQAIGSVQVRSIEPYQVAISFFKTTNIIFSHAIISVDRGSKDVLAQKAKGVENILQIKAAKEGFPETNLTVVTADGKLNSFLIDYADQPSILNLSLTGSEPTNTIFLSPENINQAIVERYAKTAILSKKKVRGIKDKDFGIRLRMNGLFIQGNVMYMRINIENQSNINYDIDQLRFFIRDQKKAKRTATQEIEILPVLTYNNTDKIKGQTSNTIVFALSKFTIPDKKYLAIQLMEKNGGRHLELHIKNKTIVKALPID
ncbi:MAG: conjugative transposon protein TraN [Sphingobacteriia bacterium 24-36-13]|jgi:conjugative transposon TraN protein|uniref:conjugative transposon protein TraN n=1 Tax=Chitinophagaceae TaxID=563835 RepID=UPI000942FA61|nr:MULTISPECIES: conjugative transposon protein TraN [Chitinophagaceae]OYY11592.1 MAG: conjugative transposon protein TraN [Sphingobacteriia bacterium 35-36-14]OYZ55296.1 MAG: conjugative transposon protein TraN [Sphingobacteriia bacterium 24-36-13]OZA66256.1 MAG: conjugative transposon protein TraN [Sphingobacteriia bacterium 39-36-14]RWZ89405.1 MAG: conjugative transposon protein TraN [Hydrotalea sp. AMD]HQS22831.1 conjugative transposon protein TraN [Sediminibacterium sp.]